MTSDGGLHDLQAVLARVKRTYANDQSLRNGPKAGKYKWPDTGLGGLGKRFLR